MKILFSNSYSLCGGELIYCVLVKKAYNGMSAYMLQRWKNNDTKDFDFSIHMMMI